MNIRDCLTDLWKRGYFSSYRSVKEIRATLLEKYGLTHSNISASLNRCREFLRRDEKGWIQKKRFDPSERTNSLAENHFSVLGIHPKIERASKKLFSDGYYAEAIFAAYKTVDKMVQAKSGCIYMSGKNLMFKVFNKDNPILALNDGISISDKDEQEGFMHIFAGASQGIRNPKAHDNVIQKSAEVTLQYLGLASLLCRMVDGSKKVRDHPR
ncbi:MAG: TIGR02391 family protein [Nitrososphaerota archaeon]|nr:TIGR02391 family protein [Nitrososphaerota archaeon]